MGWRGGAKGLVERTHSHIHSHSHTHTHTHTQDYEGAQLGWEQRELELKQQLDQLKQQQGRMVSAANRMERATGNIPDPHVRLIPYPVSFASTAHQCMVVSAFECTI